MQAQSFRQLGDVSICDNAQVHLGDNYAIHHHYAGSQTPEDTYKCLLASLSFSGMGARARNVATALPATCDWITDHPLFAKWMDDRETPQHNGFLWIKGKPGSGKSTIMKRALAWADRTSQIVISYFFDARSPHVLEKSCIGLCRSLVHQLLLRLPSIQSAFIQRFASKVTNNVVAEEWTEVELQNFLIDLHWPPSTQPVNVFIDALDEGEDDDVRQLILFLENWTEYIAAAHHGGQLRICLSSRHYPHITVARSLSLVLEHQAEHDRDIELYIRRRLAGGEDATADKIRQEIQARSAGIFLWVVLVIPVLNKAYDQGKNAAAMLRKLDEVPRNLHDLFSQILYRDSDEMSECAALLQWVLFAQRNLQPLELYRAVQMSCHNSDGNKRDEKTEDEAIRYLRNCSRGLVELTKARIPTVQFIHELVRGYLVSDGAFGCSNAQISAAEFCAQPFQAATCHRNLAEVCLRYLLKSYQENHLGEDVSMTDRLARYAAKFWWQHLQLSPIPSCAKVIGLALELLTSNKESLAYWVRLYDIKEHEDYQQSWLRPADSSQVVSISPLYYAALIGRVELVHGVLTLGVDVNTTGGQYGNALQAASASGHYEAVKLLLNAGANVNLEGGFYHTALQAAASLTKVAGQGALVQLLVTAGANVNAKGGIYHTALSAAAWTGNEEAVQVLLENGVNVNVRQTDAGGALLGATTQGHKKVVQMLLDKGADVYDQDNKGSILQRTAGAGQSSILAILLSKVPDLQVVGNLVLPRIQDLRMSKVKVTMLQAAAFSRQGEVVQMLLDKGADINDASGELGTALQAAAYMGDLNANVVRLLLNNGANVNAKGGKFGTALIAASYTRSSRVLQMLLDANADLNTVAGCICPHAHYGMYQSFVMSTALQIASAWGHDHWISDMLDTQYGISLAGNVSRSTAWGPSEKAVQVLLRAGAKVNTRAGIYGNALQVASRHGKEGVVQLLLEAGANVNTRGGIHGHALGAASTYGYEETVQMLIDAGADVNASTDGFASPLQAASTYGAERVVQILLNSDADVNAGYEAGDSALDRAVRMGYSKIAKLLIEHGATQR